MATPHQLRPIAITLIATGAILILVAAVLLLLSLFAPNGHVANTSPTAIDIVERGYLRCEISNQLPGLATRTSWLAIDSSRLHQDDIDGEFFFEATGLEADFCRAISIALFGDQNAVAFRLSSGKTAHRMNALSRNEIDVLFSSTSFTSADNETYPIDYGPAYYFEPIVLMLENKKGTGEAHLTRQSFSSLKVCGTKSTHTAMAVKLYSTANESDWEFITSSGDTSVFRSYLHTATAYENAACDAVVGRHSVLRQYIQKNPNESGRIEQSVLVPLGHHFVSPHVVAVSNRDRRWLDIVSNVLWATMDADARGMTSAGEKVYRRGALWESLGLDPANAGKLVKGLGNYREIYQRNLAGINPDTGVNRHYLLDEKGLLVVPY